MAYPTKPGLRKESIVFNGYTYNRYPDSPRQTHRRYFSRSGGALLHRALWEAAHGAIPAGWHVHHKDGNYLNNTLENLGCLDPRAHAAEHREDRRRVGRRPEHLAKLDMAREKASEWHKSDAGREWHRGHAKTSLAKAHAAYKPPEPRGCVCQSCGGAFVARSNKAQFCSPACWREHHNAVARERGIQSRSGYRCTHCAVEFVAATTKQKYCTAKCKTAAGNAAKRARIQLERGAG